MVPQAGQVTSFDISAGDSHTGCVLVVADQEGLLETASIEKDPDGAIEELVHEEGHVGTGAGHTEGEAGDSELGRHVHEVDATQGTHQHLVAGDDVALATVFRTIDAVLVVVVFATVVSTHGADTAIIGAAHTIFGARAGPVRAPWARATIVRAREAVLAFSVAPVVAASRADPTVRGAGRAILAELGLAETVAARIAMATILRARHARFGWVTDAVAAGITEATIGGTGRTGLGAGAPPITTCVAETAVLRASATGLARIAVAIATARTPAAILGTGEAIFSSTDAITTGVAESAIFGTGATALIGVAGTIGAPRTCSAIPGTAGAVLARRAAPVSATLTLTAIPLT